MGLFNLFKSKLTAQQERDYELKKQVLVVCDAAKKSGDKKEQTTLSDHKDYENGFQIMVSTLLDSTDSVERKKYLVEGSFFMANDPNPDSTTRKLGQGMADAVMYIKKNANANGLTIYGDPIKKTNKGVFKK